MTPYSYTILRYIHDPAAGEAVNVGVLVYAPQAHYVRFLRDGRYGHLSRLFAGFSFEHYNAYLSWLAGAVERFHASLSQSQAQLFSLGELPADAGALARQLVPDQGLSFQFGQVGAGITRRVPATAQALFERFVSGQRPADGKQKRRNDEDVWDAYSPALSRHAITRVLRPQTITTPGFEISLAHTFQNEKLHAIEPMSFDYLDSASIRDKAARWAGYGLALQESEDFATLYLLLGKPSLASHWRDYARAKDYLSKLPVRTEVIEEDAAEDFARYLAAYMRQHGVLPAEPLAAESEDLEDQDRQPQAQLA